jgi:hypothetical protein
VKQGLCCLIQNKITFVQQLQVQNQTLNFTKIISADSEVKHADGDTMCMGRMYMLWSKTEIVRRHTSPGHCQQ